MHPSRFLPVVLGAEDRARERADAWRQLHRRPDAPPPAAPHAARATLRGRLARAVVAVFALPGLRRRSVRVVRDG